MSDLFEGQLESFDWDQLSLEQLKRIQSRVGKAIGLKQQALKTVQADSSPIPKTGYKATISKVFPNHLQSRLFEYQRCIFIVSLGSKNFEKRRLKASIRWISEHFKTCLVLIGDSVYRLTLEVRGQAQEKDNESLSKALYMGQKFLNENRLLFEHHATACDFIFKFTSEIDKQEKFEAYYQEFRDLYKTNESFAQLVNSYAETYLSRREQVDVVGSVAHNQSQLAIDYLLEESAIFTCLAEDGWSVFVYPGSIKTFEEIAEGVHPEVPFFLKKMIWVSLRLKKKATST